MIYLNFPDIMVFDKSLNNGKEIFHFFINKFTKITKKIMSCEFEVLNRLTIYLEIYLMNFILIMLTENKLLT